MTAVAEKPRDREAEKTRRTERERAAVEAEQFRRSESARLERLFLNQDAIREWAKHQIVPLLLASDGVSPEIGFEVSQGLLDEYLTQMVAAMHDKVEEFAGHVRQGRVKGRPFVLS